MSVEIGARRESAALPMCGGVMVEWLEKLKALVIGLWPLVNTKAREQAKAKADEAARQVNTLEDARDASEKRE